MNNLSKQIIVDWQRGNIPYFYAPPKNEEEEEREEKRITEAAEKVKNPIEAAEEQVKLTDA
jgi:guanylate kinase